MAVTKLAGPYLPIEGPPATPPLHGLRDSARGIPADGARWEFGLNFFPETCATVLAWSPLCSGGDSIPGGDVSFDEPPVNAALVLADPFTLYVGFECSTLGYPSRDDIGRVTRQLEAGTSKGMEAQFASDPLGMGGFSLATGTPNAQGSVRTGTAGILNASAVTVPVAVSTTRALAMLSAALGSCGLGAQGMLHVTPDLAEEWTFYLEKDGARMVTKTRGDIVVVGSGYTGVGPVGNPSAAPSVSKVWAYATGPVEYRLEDGVRFEARSTAEVMDRKQNELEWYGQRNCVLYLAECCTYAVLVDLDLSST